MAQNIGISMKSVLLSSDPVHTMKDAFNNKLRNIRNKISQVIPSKTISMETIKEDVWRDLSAVYYKYEDSTQKKAFREIMSEISEKINEDKWDRVYRKLHSIESTPTTIGIA